MSVLCVNCFTVLTVKYLTDRMGKKTSGNYIGGRRGTAGWVPQGQVHDGIKGWCD